MRLESFKNKKVTRRKMILISLGVITIIGVSLLLYKTFASFKSEVTFPMMSGKVNYYGNDDVYFAFYNGEEKLSTIPKKDNNDNLVFDHSVCDNGASVSWNEDEWAPLVKNLTKTKTKCTLYFVKGKPKAQFPGKEIQLALEGKDGLYAIEHNNLTELDSKWNKTEYRYAGVNPDNYVMFNNEIWRIIGLVNVKTSSGVEQRIKIIRTNGINGQKDFGNYAWDRLTGYSNNWTTSKLKDMLNGIYYNSGNGECYTGSFSFWASQSTCDFSGNGELPKGLNDTARKMIDSEVIWNIGGSNSYQDVTAGMYYEKERGTNTPQDNETMEYYPSEWTSENDETYHKGIGLMYPSDYGYATNGGLLGRENCFEETLYNWKLGEYLTECANNDWLKPIARDEEELNYNWLISSRSSDSINASVVDSDGCVGGSDARHSLGVWPVGYLLPSVTIYAGDGSINNPFKLSGN